MGDDPRANGAPALTIADGDAARLREQIEATRAELGDTVAALAVKADVRRQAHDRAERLRRRAREQRDALLGRARATSPEAADAAERAAGSAAERARPWPLLAAAALALGFLLGRATRKR